MLSRSGLFSFSVQSLIYNDHNRLLLVDWLNAWMDIIIPYGTKSYVYLSVHSYRKEWSVKNNVTNQLSTDIFILVQNIVYAAILTFFVNENNSSLIQREQLVNKKIEQLKKSPPGFFCRPHRWPNQGQALLCWGCLPPPPTTNDQYGWREEIKWQLCLLWIVNHCAIESKIEKNNCFTQLFQIILLEIDWKIWPVSIRAKHPLYCVLRHFSQRCEEGKFFVSNHVWGTLRRNMSTKSFQIQVKH